MSIFRIYSSFTNLICLSEASVTTPIWKNKFKLEILAIVRCLEFSLQYT